MKLPTDTIDALLPFLDVESSNIPSHKQANYHLKKVVLFFFKNLFEVTFSLLTSVH